MDEVVEIAELIDYRGLAPTNFMVVDIGDIFDEMEERIYAAGEIPVHSRYHENFGSFLEEIYDSVGYLPCFDLAAINNINNVLQACGQFFDHYAFTPLQHQLWHEASRRIVERLIEFRVYDKRFENRYDYHAIRGDALVLKYFE